MKGFPNVVRALQLDLKILRVQEREVTDPEDRRRLNDRMSELKNAIVALGGSSESEGADGHKKAQEDTRTGARL